MFGLFFCLFVTPSRRSGPAVLLRIRQERRRQDGSSEGLPSENICAGKESAHLLAWVFFLSPHKNATAWPLAAFTHRKVNIAS